jgi:TRAP-type C4-dicarboxylate transport system permease small subunit
MANQHPQVSAEEIAQAFDESAVEPHLARYALEDWLTLVIFWGMALCVFLQFFTRYVLNNSLAWTEEIAINCLVVVVFLGSVMCVRLTRHIQVDVLYHYIPRGFGRVLALAVELVTIGFFAYATQLFWRYTSIVARERMVTIDLPRNVVFYAVFAAFLLMFVRAVVIFVRDMRRGYSHLERPDTLDGVEE